MCPWQDKNRRKHILLYNMYFTPLFYCDQLIFFAADADSNTMFNSRFPVGFREDTVEMIMMVGFSLFFVTVPQFTVFDHRLGVYCVSTGYIQSYRIEGGKHSHIWNFGGIVFSVTVTVRRNINDQANMEIRAALDNGFCIFCDFAVQDIIRFIRCRQHGIFWTDTSERRQILWLHVL